MRNKISLYIADHLVDLDEQSFILFNYTMEDLSNPTIVRNSFSQQITIKGTPNNNKIFGHVARLDRTTQYGGASSGVDFSASRKTPFVIFNEMNEIVESGYVKLDDVVRTKGLLEYKITLYGGLGSFFYGLSTNEDGSKRTLADLDYFGHDGARVTSFNVQPDVFYTIKDAWKYLSGNNMTHASFWNIIKSNTIF